MKTLAVAENTLREAVRDRILYLLLFFALLMIACSKVLSLMSVGGAGAPEKIIVDVGLGAINFFCVLIAVFMGIGLVSREIDRRTIYGVVTKPLSREAFVVGKFLGLVAAIAINEAVMTASFAFTLFLWGARFEPGYAMALGLTLLESALMLALALLYSAVASPLLATMFTLCSYFVGHWLDGLKALIAKLPPGPGRIAVQAFQALWPNLEYLNVKNQVVFPDEAVRQALSREFLFGLLYGGSYAVAILTLAALAYRRKDFV